MICYCPIFSMWFRALSMPYASAVNMLQIVEILFCIIEVGVMITYPTPNSLFEASVKIL